MNSLFIPTIVLSLIRISWQYVHIPLNIGPNLPFKSSNSSFNSSGLNTEFQNFTELINEVGTEPYQGYYLTLNIGTPQQQINALLDTGSNSFAVAGRWFPGLKRYFESNRSKTYISSHKTSSVKYTQGQWSGELGSDYVSLLAKTVIVNSSLVSNVPPVRITFARITESENFFISSSNWEGIIGLAFDKMSDPYSDKIETFYTSLVKYLRIKDMFSTLFCGITARALKGALSEEEFANLSHSAFIAGGIDNTLYKRNLMYTPVVQGLYFDIVLTNITINGVPMHNDCKEFNFDKVIVDTGTTNIRFPQRVFVNVIATLKQHINSQESLPFVMEESFWTRDTLLCIPVEESSNEGGLIGDSPYIYFPDIVFTAMAENSSTIDITVSPQQYISYLGLRYDLSGIGRRNCFVLGIQKSDYGMMIGSVFLEGFYIVFDRANKRVGWAQSTCNQYTLSKRVSVSRVSQTTNPFVPYHLTLPTGKTVTISKPMDCAYKDQISLDNLSYLSSLAIVFMTCIGLILLVPLLIFLCYLHFSNFKHHHEWSRHESPEEDEISPHKESNTDDRAYLTANQIH